MILNERLFENTSSNEDKELSVEDMFKYLKEYPQYNHQYTRPVRYNDLGLSDEQVDEFFEFLNDACDGLAEFWNQNDYLAQNIYQEGRMGGHLVLDSDILEPMIFDDVQSVSDMVEHNLEDNYYPNNDDGTYDERQQQDAREDVEKEIKDSYITLKDFDDRVNELIDNLKATLDARIEDKANNKELDEDIKKTKSGKWVNVGKEGTHGEFTTKKAAREQQKAMFAQGFKSEALENTKRFKWELFDQNDRLIDSESGFASEEEAKQNAIREIDVYDTVLKRHPEYTFRIKEFVENIDSDDDRFDMVDDINESFNPAPIIGIIREFLQEHPFENEAHNTFEDFEEYIAYELFDKEVKELTSEESYAISDVWESLNESLSKESFKPMSYEQAKKYFKDKRNIDLTKDLYQDIMSLGRGKSDESFSKNAIKDDIKESFKVVDKNGKKVPQGGGFTSRKEAEMFAAQYGEKDLRVVKESLDGIEDIGESKFGTKEYKYKKYTIEYFPIDAHMDGMEPQHIESYIIKSPAVLTNSGYHLPLYCEDEKGNEVNFRSLQQVKDWIDKFDGKFKLQWKHGDELHAVIKDEFLDESLYQTDSISGNKMTFEVSDDGKFIVKDGEKVILNTKVVDVQDTKNQIKSMQDIEILREGYTPKQQRVLDAFYKDMNFGFDSNRVIINKVTNNTVEFTLDGVSDVYKLNKESKIEDLNENLDDEVAKEVEMIFSSADETFPSRMLSRLKSDFKYILGAVKDNAEKNNESVSLNTINKHLWFHDIDKQAALMKEIYERLDEKPEDLTLQDIDNFVTETKQLLNKKKAIEEDLEREIEDLNENPGDEEKIDPTAGLETVLNDLINDENEAINGYNSAIVNFEVEGRGDLTQVFRDIIKDEQNHIGNLQKVLNEINPDTLKNIQDGQKEAEETLQSDSNSETEETNE